MSPGRSWQILKTRDDRSPVLLEHDATAADPERQFRLSAGVSCSWTRSGKLIGPSELRPRIEPWLTALVQAEHLALLSGSGLTHGVHGLATDEPLQGMAPAAFPEFSEAIAADARRTAEAAGREVGNVEDQIRTATELLRGLEIISSAKSEDDPLRKRVALLREALNQTLRSFADSILHGERGLVSSPETRRESALSYLVGFLMSFASRSGTRERLQLFTTNYDRFIEAGADAAGLRLVDRFVGTLAPVFRSSRLDVDLHYNPPGIRGEPRYLEGVARFTKLHGSVDWIDCDGMIRRVGLPFGTADAAPYLAIPGIGTVDPLGLMIYPNSAKDRETAAFPYVELFRDFAAAICRPNSVLFCYGYSFGDEHINRVVEDMLTNPSSHLVIISYDDPLGRIMRTYERLGRQAQVTLLIGDHLGDLRTLVDHYLPKPAIDRTTMRMADLLKARWGPSSERPGASGDSSPAGEEGVA